MKAQFFFILRLQSFNTHLHQQLSTFACEFLELINTKNVFHFFNNDRKIVFKFQNYISRLFEKNVQIFCKTINPSYLISYIETFSSRKTFLSHVATFFSLEIISRLLNDFTLCQLRSAYSRIISAHYMTNNYWTFIFSFYLFMNARIQNFVCMFVFMSARVFQL